MGVTYGVGGFFRINGYVIRARSCGSSARAEIHRQRAVAVFRAGSGKYWFGGGLRNGIVRTVKYSRFDEPVKSITNAAFAAPSIAPPAGLLRLTKNCRFACKILFV